MVVNPLIDKKFDNFKTKLLIAANLNSLEEVRDAILFLVEELEKEEKRLSRKRYYTKKWRQKAHGEHQESHGELSVKPLNGHKIVHGEILGYNPLINNEIPHGDVHGEKVVNTISKKEDIITTLASKKRHKSRSSLPSNFQLDPAMTEFASKRGWPSLKVSTQFEKFCSHHQGKGTLAADWPATWRTWVLNDYDATKSSPAKPLFDSRRSII
jgi:hypothetical protein